jgi:hypothetical protein
LYPLYKAVFVSTNTRTIHYLNLKSPRILSWAFFMFRLSLIFLLL